MKRILVAMLIISMTAGMTLQNVKASDEEVYYSESQMESIAQNYTENESLFEKCLCSDEGIAYWKMMHKIFSTCMVHDQALIIVAFFV